MLPLETARLPPADGGDADPAGSVAKCQVAARLVEVAGADMQEFMAVFGPGPFPELKPRIGRPGDR